MNNKAIDKIKKLLRLAQSANEHEAAAAMSRAQALMQQHGLSHESPELSDIDCVSIKSKFKARKPANYFASLTAIIAKAFGCQPHFTWSWIEEAYFVNFTGHNERPEIAQYAYQVLERQLIRARKDYIASQNKRIKRSTKTARADIFCEAWVASVHNKVKAFVLSDEESQQLSQYMEAKHPDLKTAKTREASEKYARGGADDAYWSGAAAGRKAQLNRGMHGAEQGKLEAKA